MVVSTERKMSRSRFRTQRWIAIIGSMTAKLSRPNADTAPTPTNLHVPARLDSTQSMCTSPFMPRHCSLLPFMAL